MTTDNSINYMQISIGDIIEFDSVIPSKPLTAPSIYIFSGDEKTERIRGEVVKEDYVMSMRGGGRGSSYKNVKIIGNITENPELLGQDHFNWMVNFRKIL